MVGMRAGTGSSVGYSGMYLRQGLIAFIEQSKEGTTYYNGISSDHPDLIDRSDLLESLFPIPQGRHSHLPTIETVYGVFNTSLNPVWDTVAPQICKFLKDINIRYSTINAARFVTHGEDRKDTLGPVVIWIATHHTTTTCRERPRRFLGHSRSS